MRLHLAGKRPEIFDRVEALGFQIFDSGKPYDLNIIAERNPKGEADKFDDYLHVFYQMRGEWQWHAYSVTTDAGLYYLKNYGVPSGTAILCHPQQMRGVYKIDKHNGKYDALCQRNGPVKVWRDRNKDHIHDMMGEVYEGFYGINIHKSGINSVKVGAWSAGCTVFANEADFDEFMDLCRKQIKNTGWDSFTYTLIMGE